MAVQIHIYPFLSDNYCVLLHDSATGSTASIDAIDAEAINQGLAKKGWTLTDIFVTHHHWDHTDGIVALKAQHDVNVAGPASENQKIDGLDTLVRGGDVVALGQTNLTIIHCPGHTLGHVAFHDEKNQNLFCGDALFSLGCGRMFEGSAAPMWEGLKNLRSLPDATNVYCGHEYSAGNARFAQSIDPQNTDLKNRANQIQKLREVGKPTVPFNLGEDKKANPFLRADTAEMASNMDLNTSHPWEVFAAIRKAKDNF